MSRALEVEIGVWNSQGGKDKHLSLTFSLSLSLSTFPSLSHINFFFLFL